MGGTLQEGGWGGLVRFRKPPLRQMQQGQGLTEAGSPGWRKQGKEYRRAGDREVLRLEDSGE